MKKIKNVEQNWGIAILLICFCLISCLAIYAATHTLYYVKMQLIWYIIGSIAIILLMQFNDEKLWKIAPYAYLLGIFLLIIVLFFGTTIGGAKRWINLGIMNFQTSEVMKLALIIFLARVVTAHNRAYLNRTFKSDSFLLLKIGVISLVPIVLVMLQPDLGTTIVFLALIAGITLVSGITWKLLFPIFASFFSIFGGLFYLVLAHREWLYKIGFHAYQFDRVDTWLNPYSDMSGNSYQLTQSLKAIGSGGMFGKGLAVSEVVVPENHTDFIFTVIGENFGFIGGCLLLLLYFVLIYRFIVTIFGTKNEFYSYIVTGTVMLICFHIFENIGMTIGILPVTGIPLPFISYGGSSLLGNMIATGLVLAMNYQHKEYPFSKKHQLF
ncbi:rod shape-determining protein RodA [Isobaculum melis]|uniref:Rod shape determining protein RodA n=1 Tax=Isobaculum melis TaxID=142588 RepID=A0A1H9U7D6_9LACT|nr:rod shape-determining protein RodA [Isobaculum melis]SES05013.1 rod shape determining protein RodA [Isobaculum melis]